MAGLAVNVTATTAEAARNRIFIFFISSGFLTYACCHVMPLIVASYHHARGKLAP
jgi:hypothetical protein